MPGQGEQIFLMENHDQALQVWRDAGMRQKTLVHIDAHDDMWWVEDPAATNIANFICRALQDNIAGEVFWVVPAQTLETSKGLKAMRRRVKKIGGEYPGKPAAIRLGGNGLATEILGKPLRVCTLDNLPRLNDRVLLDIDVDFLVIPCAVNRSDGPAPLPWMWPDELLAGLGARQLRPELVTIAYSVEGGYTPLKWKYLGDELAGRLGKAQENGPGRRGMTLMGEGARAAYGGELSWAGEKYREAAALLPTLAAPCFHLAHLCLDNGQMDAAQDYYREALGRDSSYRTAYNSAGYQYYCQRRFREAEGEHRRILTLDPGDPYAHFGLGQIAARQKHWVEAEACLRRSLELKADLIDAYGTLGEVLVKQGRRREAIRAYERYLVLALAGHRPLAGPILSSPEGPCLLDPEHFQIHARLARLYDGLGEDNRAINGYRLGIAKGCDGVFPHSRLAHIYLKQGEWRKSANEALQAVKMIPWEVRHAARRLRKTGRRLARRVREALGRQECPPLAGSLRQP